MCLCVCQPFSSVHPRIIKRPGLCFNQFLLWIYYSPIIFHNKDPRGDFLPVSFLQFLIQRQQHFFKVSVVTVCWGWFKDTYLQSLTIPDRSFFIFFFIVNSKDNGMSFPICHAEKCLLSNCFRSSETSI